MPNQLPGSGLCVELNQATPLVGLNQAANWGGSSMDTMTVVPLTPGQVFSARGRGAFSLTLEGERGPRVSGRQGTLDLLLLTGTAGTVRTVATLTDDVASPTRYIAIRVDTSNRPYVRLNDAGGTNVGTVTPSFAAIGAGRTVSVRLAWDSLNAIDTLSGRRASFRVERELVAGANWSTAPTANWSSFQPTHLVLGASLGDADFNGSVLSLQVSNQVTI